MLALPEGYSITSASREDIPALIAVDKAASELFAPTGLINADALDDHVPADVFETAILNDHLFVARDQTDAAIGFVLTSERGSGLYLDQVSVHPDHGQKGIGRALVVRILKDTEYRSLPHVTLSTFRDLPWNGPFYASLGFKEITREKREPFMLEIEEAQTPFMDVSQRCFMRRKVRRPLFRLRRS